MELRQLETFCVLAEERHFGRAAARLYVSQSSVTQQLQRLEGELGVLLVRRTSRQVSLTPAGELLQEEARAVLRRVENVSQAVRDMGAAHEGMLYIGTNFPASRVHLPNLLNHLRETSPGLTVAVRELGSVHQEEALVRGDLHLGLLYGPPTSSRLDSAEIGAVDLVALLRPGHPLAADDVVDLRHAHRYPLMTRSEGSGPLLGDRVREAAATVGVRLGAERAVTSDLYLALAASDAIAVTSRPRGRQGEASGLLVRDISPIPRPLELHVAWDRTTSDRWVDAARTFLVSRADPAGRTLR